MTEAELAVEEAQVGEGRLISRKGCICFCCCCCFKPTGAKATRLLERRPRLPPVLHGLALGCFAAIFAGFWWLTIRAEWRGEQHS